MDTYLPFALAVLALLATPGPTNTLMAASGAARGFGRSLPLLVGELGGYFVAITVWSEGIGAVASTLPWVRIVAELAAVAFLVWSAVKLWMAPGVETGPARVIGVGTVFLTTLLNPKAIVFAFVIFPAIGFLERLPYLGVFGILVVATATGWMLIGAGAARTVPHLLAGRTLNRAVALALTVFAALLLVRVIQG